MRTIIQLTLVALFWSGIYIIGENTVHAVHPLMVAFVRFLLTTLCIFPILWWKERNSWQLKKSEFFPFLLLGLLGIAIYNAFFFIGLKEAGAIKSSIIIAAIPMVTTLFATIIYKERLTLNQMAGVFLSFFGVVLVVTNGRFQTIGFLSGGVLWVIGCVILWSVYTIFGKKYMKSIPPLKYTSYTALFGTLFLLPIAYFFGSINFFTITSSNWFSIFYMVIFATIISFFWWNQGVKDIGPAKTSIFLNLVPVFTLLLSILLGQDVNGSNIIGTILVVGGVSLTNVKLKENLTRHTNIKP